MWVAAYGAIIGAVGEGAGLPIVFWVMAGAHLLAALAILPVRASRVASPAVATD